MDLGLELVLHLLVLIFWLFGEDGNVRRYVPSFDHEITAAGDEHVVFTIIDIYHIQDYIFVLSHH